MGRSQERCPATDALLVAPSRNRASSAASSTSAIALQLLRRPFATCSAPAQLALLRTRHLLRVNLGAATGKTPRTTRSGVRVGPALGTRQPRTHVSRALLAQIRTRDLPHTKTNQCLHLLPSTHTLEQPRLSTSPPLPPQSTPYLCILELDLLHVRLPLQALPSKGMLRSITSITSSLPPVVCRAWSASITNIEHGRVEQPLSHVFSRVWCSCSTVNLHRRRV